MVSLLPLRVGVYKEPLLAWPGLGATGLSTCLACLGIAHGEGLVGGSVTVAAALRLYLQPFCFWSRLFLWLLESWAEDSISPVELMTDQTALH